MDRLKMQSPNLVDENIVKIAKLFPNCITEDRDESGKIHRGVDFDQLRQELSAVLVEGPRERYTLSWPGKNAAILTANAPIAKTLRPCEEESVDFENTKNLYIEGDNLDVLKLLQETYLNKVGMMYIDQPYNTGNDFIYKDDFAEDTDSFLQRSNQEDEEGNRLVANTEANGRFHSDWLSMMYPRLKLAKNLLRDDGAIFVSCNDGEQARLRIVLDELFGEKNFVAQIIWQRSKKGDAKLIASVHEYILCYVRDKSRVLERGVWRRKKDGVAEVLAKYSEFRKRFNGDHEQIRTAMQTWYRGLNDSDPRKSHKHYNWSDDRGLYFAADFAGPDDGRENRPRHDIIHPTTGKPCKKPSTGWRWDEKNTKWALEQTPPRIHFGPDETTIPNRKSYLEEIDSEPYPSVFYRDGRSATLEVEGLLGKGWFPFPKNTEIISELIELVTGPNDLIFDFFAGSGTTAHAVFNVNRIQGSKRHFIMVQLPEPTGKEEFATIAEIGKERIRRAGKKIKAEWMEKQPTLYDAPSEANAPDIGFRVFKVDTSNMKDVYYTPDGLKQENLELFKDHIKPDRRPEDLLFQVFLDWGLDLTLPIAKDTIDGKTVFFVDTNALMACFDSGITEELVRKLAKHKPLRAVFRDDAFGSDSVKINVEQIFRLLSPATEVKSI